MTGDDPAAAVALGHHLTVPAPARDAKWRHRFYDLVDIAQLCQRDPRISIGADEFPYYQLDVPAAGRPAETVTVPALITTATSRGFGISVNRRGAQSWLFTCGDLVTRRCFGTYEFPRIGVPAMADPVLREMRKDPADLSIGAPPASLLPAFVQPLLRRYFTQRLGIADPGVLALLSERQNPPEQLVFRLSRADFSDQRAFESALAGLAWFLPRHVVVSVLPPEVVAGLEQAFVPLQG